MEDNTAAKEKKSTAQNLIDDASEYIQLYLKLGAVNATEKATTVATIALTGTLLSFFLLFILFFLGIGLAIWVGEIMNDQKIGYFIVAGAYLLFSLIFVAIRKRYIFPIVRDHIIRKAYE